MRKFTLIFVLLILTVSFVVVYLYFANDTKTLIPKTTETQTTSGEVEEYTGVDLGPSVYEDYTAEAYNKALEENRIVFLYFTANWCPTCREQEPVNKLVFEKLDGVGVVGLRVHILDSETTDETERLAKKFDVTYQHTYVILDSKGAVNYKYTGPLLESEVVGKIVGAVGASGEEIKKIEVIANEFSFSPSNFLLSKGQKVELTLKNEGGMVHNLVIDELGVSTGNVLPGESIVINFTASKEIGKVEYYCSIGNHRLLGMSGSMEVR